LSHKAVMRYSEIKGIPLYAWINDSSKRIYGKEATLDNPDIVKHYSTVSCKDEKEYNQLMTNKQKNDTYFSYWDIERNDPALIQTIEELGEEANGACAKLKIVEIPDDVKWELDEYDGIEHVQEQCRKWS